MDRLRSWALSVTVIGGSFVALAWNALTSGVPGPFASAGGAWLLLLAIGGLLAATAAIAALVLPERAEIEVLLARISHVMGAPALACGVVAWALFGIFFVYAMAPSWNPPLMRLSLRVIATPTVFVLTAAVGTALAAIGLSARLFSRGRGSARRRFGDILPLASGAAMAVSPWAAFAMMD